MATLRHKIFILLFLIVLVLPLVDQALRLDSTVAMNELRKKSHLPKLEFSWRFYQRDFQKFTAAFEEYYKDHFGFRNFLISFYKNSKFKLFNVYTTKQVVRGKEDWFFYMTLPLLEALKSKRSFTPDELSKWLETVSSTKTELSKLGAEYMMVPVPNKHSVYENKLPQWLQGLSAITRYEQLALDLPKILVDGFVELKIHLKGHSKKHQVFQKADTHWNDLGAYWAHVKLVKQLNKIKKRKGWIIFEPLGLDAFRLVKTQVYSGDLMRLIAVKQINTFENFSIEEKKSLNAEKIERINSSPHWAVPNVTLNKNDSAGPSVLIFHDSFFDEIYPFLIPHFSKIMNIRSYDIHPKLVEKHKPDIVISLFVERSMVNSPRILECNKHICEHVRRDLDEAIEKLRYKKAEK